MNILIVCTGNTCRSPMAEGILKSMLGKDDNTRVLSGGIFANEGEGASANAIAALADMDIDISDHAAHGLNAEVVKDADLILTMTHSHKQMLISMFGDAAEKTYTMYEYIGKDGDVADPYGGDLECYKRCAREIYALLLEAYKKIRSGIR